MQVQIAIPDDIAQSLSTKWGDLENKLLEMVIIAAYSEGSISVGKVREILGLSTRLEAEAWLSDRHVDLPYHETDFEADRQVHNKLRQAGRIPT